MVVEILYYFLPIIVMLGILTSYEDLKYGKIKNKYIVFALIYSLIVNFILVLFVLFIGQKLNYGYLLEFFTNLVFVLILGGFLWYNGFWTSGDAKLYLVYAVLIPLSVYNFGYIKYMPGLILLINTFIPLTLVYFVKIILKTSFNEKKKVFLEIFKLKEIITYFLFVFVLLWIPQLFVDFLGVYISFIEIMIFTLFVSFFLRTYFSKKYLKILVVLCVVRLLFDKSVYSIRFLETIVWLFVILFVFKAFFVELGKNVFSENIMLKELKKGMISTDRIYKKKGFYFKELNGVNSKRKYFFNRYGEGFSSYDVGKLKRLEKKGLLKFSSLNINKITPFAHYLFIGVLITLFFRGNIISSLINFNYLSNNLNYFLDLSGWIFVSCLIAVIIYRILLKTTKVK